MKKFKLVFFLISIFIFTSCSISSEKIEANSSVNDFNYINTPYFLVKTPSEFLASDTLYMNFDEDNEIALGINSISPLGNKTETEIYEEIRDLYISSLTIIEIDDSLSTWVSDDGTVCYVASSITKAEDSVFVATEFLIAPEHNLVLTLNAQTSIFENLDLNLVSSMRKSIDFRDINTDVLSNNSFIDGDNGYLVLNEDKTFQYYFSKDNKDDNYFSGTYSSYYKDEAISALTSLNSLENSENTFRDVISSQLKNYSMLSSEDYNDYVISSNDFYSLILYVESSVINKKEEKTSEIIPYYGFFVAPLNAYDCVNLANGEEFLFIKE